MRTRWSPNIKNFISRTFVILISPKKVLNLSTSRLRPCRRPLGFWLVGCGMFGPYVFYSFCWNLCWLVCFWTFVSRSVFEIMVAGETDIVPFGVFGASIWAAWGTMEWSSGTWEHKKALGPLDFLRILGGFQEHIFKAFPTIRSNMCFFVFVSMSFFMTCGSNLYVWS